MGNQPPITRGVIDAVICPHCGKPNDFRTLDEQQLLDTGHTIDCDHCLRVMEVVRIQMLKVIAVRQSDGRRDDRRLPPRQGAGRQQLRQPQQPQRAVGIGAKIRGLLGGPKRG